MKITRFKGDTDPIVFTIKKDGVAMDITGSILTFYYGSNSIIGEIISAENGKVSFNVNDSDFNTIGTHKYKITKQDASIKKTIIKNVVVVNDDSVE